MPIFFPPSLRAAEADLTPTVEALGMDKMVGVTERWERARDLHREGAGRRPAGHGSAPYWSRVAVAFLLLLAVFGVALFLGKTPEYAKASDSLLRCFELLFAAILALLGIEDAKHG